ncbi:hypothetical protein GCM10010271_33530 [Streptomyces kurssanovii]|nr:hypothetical protein GCM10010271_33530 [Streptomyces kurssanovii]
MASITRRSTGTSRSWARWRRTSTEAEATARRGTKPAFSPLEQGKAVVGVHAEVPSEEQLSFLTAAFTYGQEGRGDTAPYGWT